MRFSIPRANLDSSKASNYDILAELTERGIKRVKNEIALTSPLLSAL